MGEGTDLTQNVVEFTAIDAFIPPSGLCFMKCIKFLPGKNYEQDFSDFIRSEDRRRNVKTTARIRPFVRNIILTLDTLAKLECILDLTQKEIKFCNCIKIIFV